MKNIFQTIFQRKILVTLLLGFSSGLPLTLTGAVLQAWFATTEASLMLISFLGFVGIPYTFKFLWAPIMDRWVPPFLGRRRGWILCCQILLILALAAMAMFSPETQPRALLFCAMLVVIFSASQDIAINAYNTDMLNPEERSLGAAMTINGYRIAMLVAGGLTLILADQFGFKFGYLVMAALIGIGIIGTLLGPTPSLNVAPPKRLYDCTVLPFIDFLSRNKAVWILFFILCYKLGDAFASTLISTFLIREIHMSLTEIGTLVKVMGFLGTIVGAVWGAVLVPRLGWYRALFTFGILQTVTNLLLMPLLYTGPNRLIAGFGIFTDNLTGGMGTAAFLGFIMGLCNPRFTAFQFALLSALSAVGRVFIGPAAGLVANHWGWEAYFLMSVVFAVPGLILLKWLRPNLDQMTAAIAEERASLNASPVKA